MRLFQFILLAFTLVSCSKTSKIKKELRGEKWEIITYKKTGYVGGKQNFVAIANNIGSFTFEDKLITFLNKQHVKVSMTATLNQVAYGPYQEVLDIQKNCKYSIQKSKVDSVDAFLLVELDIYHVLKYAIKRKSQDNMIFTCDNIEYLGFDGNMEELNLQKAK